ncbi:uncharacterized protein LOC108683304 [Hyalella azteca]|uniref:Uncharacterized protein LOC108683304 n=1 Tax=Hyalella azteca TaxID=294128 RepID=A0A8B7PPF9_HYAAZ|nr:uncharacterized protein LOC108683304 [Hyalella azteca]
MEWHVSPDEMLLGAVTSVEWSDSLQEGTQSLVVTIDDMVVQNVRYQYAGPVIGFSVFNITAEGTHPVVLDITRDGCSISFHNLSFASSKEFQQSARDSNSTTEPQFRNAGLCVDKKQQSKLVTVYAPLTPDVATIRPVKNIVFIPPGIASATFIVAIPRVSLYTTSYQLNVTIVWGLNSIPNSTVSQVLNPAAGETTINVTRTFVSPAEITITATFRNPFSEQKTSAEISVRNRAKVGEVSVLAENGSSISSVLSASGDGTRIVVAPPNTNLLVTTNSSSTDATYWNLTFQGERKSQPKLPFIISFKQEGKYTLSLSSGGGKGGASLPAVVEVLVRRPLAPITVLTQPAFLRAGMPLVVGVMVPEVMGACVILDRGEGLPLLGWKGVGGCDASPPGAVEWQSEGYSARITHLFTPRSPLVKVQATLYTAVGLQTSQATSQVVPQGPCRSISVRTKTAANATISSVKRSAVARVRSTVVADCDPGTVTSIDWVISPSIEKNLTELDQFRAELQNASGSKTLPENSLLFDRNTAFASNIEMDNVTTSDTSIGIPPHTLDFGLYEVAVYYNVTLYDNTTGESLWSAGRASALVEVVSTSLVVGAVRGGATAVTRGRIHFDASAASYDYDQADGRLASYEWWCKKAGENWPDDASKGSSSSPGCFGKGPERISKPSGDGSVLDLAATEFKGAPMDVVLKVVAVSVDGRRQAGEVKVKVVQGSPPPLILGCLPPQACHPRPSGNLFVSPNRLILQSECDMPPDSEKPPDGNGCLAGMSYSWQVHGVVDVMEPEKKVLLDLVDTNTTTGLDQSNLVLLDKFWETFSEYRQFTIAVSGVHSSDPTPGFASLSIIVNQAPENGSCYIVDDISPDGITALVQAIVVACSDWVDPEGSSITKYTYYGVVNKKKLPLSFGPSPSQKMILPAASALQLYAEVADEEGSAAKHLIDVIETKLPSVEQVEQYEKDEVREKAVAALDQLKVGQLLQAEASLEGLALPGSKVGPLTAEEMEALRQRSLNKNSKMVGAVDNFAKDSMDDVVQVTSILGAVAYPLPATAEDAAVASIVSLAGSTSSSSSAAQASAMAGTASGVVASLVKGVNENVAGKTRMGASGPSQVLKKCYNETICWTKLLLCLTDTPFTNETLQTVHDIGASNMKINNEVTPGASQEPPHSLYDSFVSVIYAFFDHIRADESPSAVTSKPSQSAAFDALDMEQIQSLAILLDVSQYNSTNDTTEISNFLKSEQHLCLALRAMQCAVEHYGVDLTKELFNLEYEDVLNTTDGISCAQHLKNLAHKNPAAAQANDKEIEQLNQTSARFSPQVVSKISQFIPGVRHAKHPYYSTASSCMKA